MKSIALVTLAGIAAAVFSVAAHAQTGRPSALEVPAAAAAPRAAAADAQLGSYARYLMLNGATRETAVAAARNIDQPADALASRKLAASRAGARAQAPARQ